MIRRIVFTGGGTGGHIYPLLAVLEEVIKKSSDDILVYYIGPKNDSVFNMVRKYHVRPYPVISSKLRRYVSPLTILDIPKFFFSLVQMLWRMYLLMPDVVFSKGGPGSFPVIFAAWFYMIPVIIHESDSVPSLNAKLSKFFAKRIAISFEHAAQYFPEKKIALTGNPVRSSLVRDIPKKEAAREYFGFNINNQLLVILGGSQGATPINEFIFSHLKELLLKYQLFHQVGEVNEDEALSAIGSVLQGESDQTKKRYQYAGFLNEMMMKKILAAADIVISRAGSSAIYEIAAFGKPSILVPLPRSAGNHQLVNAYEYEKSGSTVVIEETNLTLNLLTQEIDSILENPERIKEMGERGRAFFKPDASELIADEILKLSKAV